jgi:tetratricopeptide (TPR) repeat protein
MAQAKRRVPPQDINVAIGLFERGDAAGAARLCRASLAADPRALPPRLVLASALLATRDISAALDEAEAVLSIDLAAALAHFVRGTALHELRRDREAAASLQRAVELAPGDAKSWLNYGITLTALDQLDAAVTALQRACALAPHSAEAHASLGTALVQCLRLPEAVAAYRTALRLRPDFAEASWDLGFALLLGGDFASGWAALARRKPEEERALAACGVSGAEWSGPEWKAGTDAAQTLLVVASQGLGDTIQLARYLPLLAAQGHRVLVTCDARLAPLLKTLAGVADVLTQADPLPPHDSWVALSSLPRLFATTRFTIPAPGAYLAADPVRVERWRAAIATGSSHGPAVGLVWSGNPAHANNARRSMPQAALAPLLNVSGVRFIGLQRDAGMPPPPGVIDLSAQLTDLAETAAALHALDLVITVDTAVAHLAGALGRPAWIALPYAPDWRWLLGRDDSPWYRSVRLFRQPRTGDWDSVVTQLAASLTALLQAVRP